MSKNHLNNLQSFISTAALESGQLSQFGYVARYMFLFGLYLLAKSQGNEDGAKNFKALTERAHTFIDQGFTKAARLPHDYTDMKLAFDHKFLEQHTKELSGWFNNNIRDLPRFPLDEKDLYKQGVYLITHAGTGVGASAMNTIEKYAKLLSPKVGLAFANTFRLKKGTKQEFSGKKELDNLYDQLQSTVKEIMGKPGYTITTEKRSDLKLKGVSGVQSLMRYDDLKKAIKTLSNNALYVVLSNGNISADAAAKEMKAMGFRDFPFPTSEVGYTGYVGLDPQGKLGLFTAEGKQIAVGVAPTSKITMNKKYDPIKDDSFYFTYRPPNAVGISRAYTMNFKQEATEEKHDKTTANTDKVGGWVKKAEQDLFNKDPMRHVPASVFLLLYLTAARVGSSKENQSKLGKAQTYGISTLRKSHVKVTTASIILDYNGKKGMHQRHTLKLDSKVNKRIGVILKSLLVGKGRDDLAFAFERPTSRNGAVQEVNPSFFRSYLNSIGVTINPHALRHIRGTELAKKLIADNPWEPSTKARTLAAKQREAEAFMKDKILSQVAVLLGHKSKRNGVEEPAWRTSLTSYVHPTLVRKWFKDHNLGVPKYVPQKLDTE